MALSSARMSQTHNMGVVLEGERMWPWGLQMLGELPALKEAPGITTKRPNSTLAFLLQTPDSQVSRRGWSTMCLKSADRNVMEQEGQGSDNME